MSREPAPAPTTDKAAELRHLFDSGFSRAPRTDDAEVENLLAIRVGHDPYALRLTEISALVAGKAFTRVPAPAPALIGIAGFRGSIVAAYDLRVLFGQVGATPPRWLALTATDTTVGLAFDQFEGHLRVPRATISVEEEGERRQARAGQVLRVAGVARTIIQISSVVDSIKARP
jgi:chemotaxis signal transduction protein